MKVGILTFHCAENYGAVLQCYALQETLRKLGYDVEVINFRPRLVTDSYRLLSKDYFDTTNIVTFIKSVVMQFLIFPYRIKRRLGFRRFVFRYLHLSSWEGYASFGLPNQYDCYVIGSDQVWNPKYNSGEDDLYFGKLPFEKSDKVKVISFAASTLGKVNQYQELYSHILGNFDSISVREKTTKDFLQPLTKTHISVVVDPSLLLDRDSWKALAAYPKINRKYVLVYQVRINSNAQRIAKKLASEIGASVIEITSDIMFSLKSGTKIVTPEQFLGYFQKAAFVVTSSFHGTVFSIIFKKPFYSLRLNDVGDNRQENLLNEVGLKDRMIDANSTPHFSQIDYSKVDSKVVRLQQQAINYLNQAIS